MFFDRAITITSLFKYYKNYKTPIHRIKEIIFSSLNGQLVKYTKDDFCALENIDININKGEVVAILGKNGSGKSTLLQSICGTLTPSLGEINVDGRIAALLELGAGFNPEFTGRENIYLNAAILGLPKKEIEKSIDDIINFSEISDYIDHPVKQYSSGMYVRLAFSIAINVDPDILIIDEALSVGDAKFQIKCLNKIKSIVASGKTVLFVSHDITSVRALCTRAIWIDKGKIVMDDDVTNTTSKYLEYMYSDSATIPNNEVVENATNKYINHWGTHKGSIKKVELKNEYNKTCSVFEIGSLMEFQLEYFIPSELISVDTKVAISIKNKKGIDLIVHSANVESNPYEGKLIRTKFTLLNQLAAGEYILVVAIERSNDSEISYLEYIEGVLCFTSVTIEKRHGLFNPEVRVEFY